MYCRFLTVATIILQGKLSFSRLARESVMIANTITVEPLKKEHAGDNISSAVLSFVYRETFVGSKCIRASFL